MCFSCCKFYKNHIPCSGIQCLICLKQTMQTKHAPNICATHALEVNFLKSEYCEKLCDLLHKTQKIYEIVNVTTWIRVVLVFMNLEELWN